MQTLTADPTTSTNATPKAYTATFSIDATRRTAGYTCAGPEPTIVAEGAEILDYAYSLMFEGRVTDGVQSLVAGLEDLRLQYAAVADDFTYFAHGICRTHPIADLLSKDPMAVAASAGRSALLEYIFGDREDAFDTTTTAAKIGAVTAQLPLVRSLRSRRTILAQRIDEVAAAGRARVLAIGATYEAELSQELKNGSIDEFVVVDLGRSTMPTPTVNGVRSVRATLPALLAGSVNLGRFNLIYAPTLFDELPDAEAKRLAEIMFTLLEPGGRIAVVNAGDELVDTGYRNAFFGNTVIGRCEADLVALTSGIPSRLVGQVRLYPDEYGLSNFVEVSRR